MERLLIHVGVGKSGTSSLQRNLFDRLPGVANLGRPRQREDDYTDFLATMLDGEPRPGTAAFAARVRAQPGCVVVSDESLTLVPHELEGVARRLKDCFPEAGILITIRGQDRAVISWYLRHVRDMSWRACFDRLAPDGRFFGCVYYDRIVAAFVEAFGRGRVHVLLYEEMASEPAVFMERLAPLVGATPDDMRMTWQERPPANPAPSRRTRLYRRLASPAKAFARALPPAVKPALRWLLVFAPLVEAFRLRVLAGGRRATLTLSEADRHRLAEIYGPGNRALAQEHGLPLDRWGYPGCG